MSFINKGREGMRGHACIGRSLGPLGMVAPFGDFDFWGIHCFQLLGLGIRGTLAMDVEIGDSG